MRRRGANTVDSLELLMDTLCNTCGGIIFITLLVVLLARGVNREVRSQLVSPEESEVLSRQIAVAKADIDAAARVMSGTGSVEAPQAIQALQNQIVSERASLRDVEASIEAAASVSASNSPEYAAAIKDNDTLRKEQLALENRKAALEAQQTAMQSRAARLGDEIQKIEATKVAQLRLPRERKSTKKPWGVILRYGEGYPVYTPTAEPNTAGVRWSEHGKGMRAEPIKGSGIAPGSGEKEWSRTLGELDRSKYYIVFYVYRDSLDAFSAFKESAAKHDFEYGWEPILGTGDLTFVEEGEAPPLPL